ncbi:DUF4013 domain-containing protein [Haloarcula halophila]|uniref:DUF4013 domain-containing protein n=1 Tax=Haloarcula TaxID=2237 RepID=UPI0023E3EF72|nr:DUF4013 domain-containing protein [Halomicroarcula sp. DFY41]
MLADALRYPQRGPGWLKTVAIGSVLTLVGAVTFVPLIPLQGYLLRVLRTTSLGQDRPPAFDGWSDLFVDGARAIAVQVAYALLPVWLLFAGFVVSGYGVFSSLGGTDLGATVEALGWVLMALSALTFVAAVYLVPAALTRLARTGRLRAAFDRREIAAAGRRPIYVVAVIEAYVALIVVTGVGTVLTVILVGAVFVFYGQVAAFYLFARGYTEASRGADDSAGSA